MTELNFKDKTIWTGDNLDILRGMNSECVDLIYLDPPFNSNRNYAAPIGSKAAGAAFEDTWTLDKLDIAWIGLIADTYPAIANLLHTSGLTHGKGMQSYLTMMAVRLIELHRVLKPTGSIYLHCDPTASHYLKQLMDAVFGAGNFRSDISWRRTRGHNDAKQGRRLYGNVRDDILFYTKSGHWTWNWQYTEYEQSYVDTAYRRVEKGTGRRFKSSDTTAAKPGGDTNYEWRVKRKAGGVWEGDLNDEYLRPKEGWEYKGVSPYRGRYWAYSRENMQKMSIEGRISYTNTGMPGYKQYLDEMLGVPVQNDWADILQARRTERTGYPTQKPLALLERIIKASSNEGDVVLDPFCGCATACVAADKLGRQWIGIDISPKAVELVNMRLQQAMGSLFHHGYVTARTDVPQRTDIEAPVNYRKQAHVIYGEQMGYCAGCRGHFEFRGLEVDHVVPRSRGGTDHRDNLQMLCSHCNRIKGDRPQEYLVARLKEMAVL